MRIDELKPAAGSRKKKKRIGRGPGSGHGKTSCKGHKGQKARAGVKIPAGFEGGQMPLHRRIPKRGFSNKRFKKEYSVINLKKLEMIKDDIEIITPEVLIDKGIIKNVKKNGIKILGDGKLSKPLIVKAHAFSKSAVKKITEVGGKTEVI